MLLLVLGRPRETYTYTRAKKTEAEIADVEEAIAKELWSAAHDLSPASR